MTIAEALDRMGQFWDIQKLKTGGILQGYGLIQKSFKQGNATGRKF
jgi:hypothetical protein